MRQLGLIRDGFPQPDALVWTWAQYTSTGAAAALLDSENVASLTKNGTGDVTATFIGGYRDTNYAASVMSISTGVLGTTSILATLSTTPFTATTIRVLSLVDSGVAADTSQTTFAIYGMP